MLRIVSSASRPSTTGRLGKAVVLRPTRRAMASTSARHADITLTVDGKEVTVPQGTFGSSDERVLTTFNRVRSHSGV